MQENRSITPNNLLDPSADPGFLSGSHIRASQSFPNTNRWSALLIKARRDEFYWKILFARIQPSALFFTYLPKSLLLSLAESYQGAVSYYGFGGSNYKVHSYQTEWSNSISQVSMCASIHVWLEGFDPFIGSLSAYDEHGPHPREHRWQLQLAIGVPPLACIGYVKSIAFCRQMQAAASSIYSFSSSPRRCSCCCPRRWRRRVVASFSVSLAHARRPRSASSCSTLATTCSSSSAAALFAMEKLGRDCISNCIQTSFHLHSCLRFDWACANVRGPDPHGETAQAHAADRHARQAHTHSHLSGPWVRGRRREDLEKKALPTIVRFLQSSNFCLSICLRKKENEGSGSLTC